MNRATKVAILFGGIIFLGYAIYSAVLKKASKLADITYRFQKFSIKKITLKDFQATIELVLTNPSDLGFTITSYDINVQVQNTPAVRISNTNIDIVIAPNKSVAIPLAIQFDPRKIGSSLLPILLDVLANKQSQDKIKIHIKGIASGKFGVISIRDIPIDYIVEV